MYQAYFFPSFQKKKTPDRRLGHSSLVSLQVRPLFIFIIIIIIVVIVIVVIIIIVIVIIINLQQLVCTFLNGLRCWFCTNSEASRAVALRKEYDSTYFFGHNKGRFFSRFSLLVL